MAVTGTMTNAGNERFGGAERNLAYTPTTSERLRPEMAFFAENPEAFGLVPDACPLATGHLLIAANGRGAEGGGVSPAYEPAYAGVEGLLAFYGDLIPSFQESELALRLAFGENSTVREHPVSRYCAVLAELTALRVLNGPAGKESFEATLSLLNIELRRALRALRKRFEALDQVEVIHDAVFEPSIGICRIREEGGGDYTVDVFSAGDFRVYLVDEQGMAPLWSTTTSAFSPDRGVGLKGKSLRIHHPAPLGVLLVSEGICALNAAEHRALRSNPGLIWRYRMRLEDYFLRLLTDCVREYEFGDRATRFFAGQAHGRDSASGALTILRDGVTYETFRLHCQNRLSNLGWQMELLADGYDPLHAPEQESRYRTEYAYLKKLLDGDPEWADTLTNALRIHILRRFEEGASEALVLPPEGVPEYKRLEHAELYKAFRRLDCENDPDRARIAENNAALRESLSEHWVTLRPLLMTEEPLVAADEAADAAAYRAVSEEIYRVCLDMNRRLAEMLERRRGMVENIRTLMLGSLESAVIEGDDWACGRAGADSVAAWMKPLKEDLPELLGEMEACWREGTERYRSLLTAYTAEREDLFRRDADHDYGGFAACWRAMTEGRLPDETWDIWRERLADVPDAVGFGDFLDDLRQIAAGTGALRARIRARAAETRMARELANRSDLRIAALRGAAYEDPDWGDEIIGVMDSASRADFLAVVRGWQETCERMERQKETYDAYSSMYGTYEA